MSAPELIYAPLGYSHHNRHRYRESDVVYIRADVAQKERDELLSALLWAMKRVALMPATPHRDFHAEDMEERIHTLLQKHDPAKGTK